MCPPDMAQNMQLNLEKQSLAAVHTYVFGKERMGLALVVELDKMQSNRDARIPDHELEGPKKELSNAMQWPAH